MNDYPVNSLTKLCCRLDADFVINFCSAVASVSNVYCEVKQVYDKNYDVLIMMC